MLSLFQFRYQKKLVVGQDQVEAIPENTVALVVNLKPKSNYIECSLLFEEKKFLSRLSFQEKSRTAVGDLLLIRGKLKPLPSAGRKEQFDYGNYLQNLGFSGLCEIDHFARIGQHQSLRFAFKNWQLSLAEQIDNWPLGNKETELLKALFLGLRGGITQETLSKFKGAGLMHLLAVSGLHLGIVYLVLSKILSLVLFGRYHRLIKSLLLWIGIWSFCLLSGAGPSVIRAATMFSLLSFSGLIRRKLNGLHLMLSSFILLLWINPLFIHQLGFLLSYSAVTGILFLVPKLQKWYQPRNKVLAYILDLLYVSIAAQLFTAPLNLYFFGSFPLYFLVANLVMLPVISLIMYWGLIYFVISAIKLPLFFMGAYDKLLGFPLKFSGLIANWPYAQLDFKISPLTAILALVFLIIWVLRPKLNRKLLGILLLCFWLINSSYALYLMRVNPIHIYLDSYPRSISIYMSSHKNSHLSIPLNLAKHKAQVNAYFTLKAQEEGLIELRSLFLDQEVLLVDEISAISDSFDGLIVYYGKSLENEKSWRQRCQDLNLKFISGRRTYLKLN